MLARFFRWLESRTDPLPPEQPEMPPASLIPFMLHYARPFWRLLLASALFSTVIALLEVTLFGFLGRLVDWLASADRATFWDDHGGQIILMGAVVLVVLPILKFFYESISHQGLWVTSPCAPAGRRTAICCGKAWSFTRMISPEGWRPR